MKKKVKVQDVKVGDYVILPLKWKEHQFWRNHFLVRNTRDIAKIAETGLEELEVDTEKSRNSEEAADGKPKNEQGPKVAMKEEGADNSDWEEFNRIPDMLSDIIADKSMPSKKKAEAVYSHSLTLMDDLFNNPSAASIGVVKKGISNVVDLVLSDEETSMNLLSITSHDFYTYTHSVNVGIQSISLAKRLYHGSDAHDMHELGAGFFLHDLGKTKISPDILNKPAKLTDEEFAIIRSHPYQGYRLLKKTEFLTEECKVITLQHHERDDGTGYPRSLRSDEISDYAKICCIADVYDALTAERSYKKAMSPFEALSFMKEKLSGHFDKKIFSSFVQLFA